MNLAHWYLRDRDIVLVQSGMRSNSVSNLVAAGYVLRLWQTRHSGIAGGCSA
jgi:hypothetical protein